MHPRPSHPVDHTNNPSAPMDTPTLTDRHGRLWIWDQMFGAYRHDDEVTTRVRTLGELHTSGSLTLPASPTPRESAGHQPSLHDIRGAFEWVAWWHSNGARPDGEDQTAVAVAILGDHAYRIIATAAQTWAGSRR